MAIYRIGKIISMMRDALGITQEELVEIYDGSETEDEKERKKVILVDHNSYDQSVDGLDEADIIEIIDHHNIGTVGTKTPINFRNMPVGSSCSIVYMLYKENHIEIPKNIAGALLSTMVRIHRASLWS